MAIPTDPIKAAAYRARQARNSAAYRARQAAAARGVEPAPRQREAHYRPPRVSGIVERAQETARSQRERRAALLKSLPDVRNPQARLRVGEQTERMAPERATAAGKARQAAAIRAQAAASKLTAVGRRRQQQIRGELQAGPLSERLRDAMTREQAARFQKLSDRIASGSAQSVGILFNYAGGQNDYSSVIERILASPESRDVEEGLGILEALAERAAKSAVMYSPKSIGRLTV